MKGHFAITLFPSRRNASKTPCANRDPYPRPDQLLWHLCGGAGRRVRHRPCSTRQRAPRRPGTFQTGSWSDCPGCRLPPSVSLAHQPTKLSTFSRLVSVFHALKREFFVGSLGSHRESRVTEAAIGSLAAGRISVSRMLVSIPSDVRNLEFGQLILIAGLSACVLPASGGVRVCANIRSKTENCANGAEVCRVQQECALLRVEFSLQQRSALGRNSFALSAVVEAGAHFHSPTSGRRINCARGKLSRRLSAPRPRS